MSHVVFPKGQYLDQYFSSSILMTFITTLFFNFHFNINFADDLFCANNNLASIQTCVDLSGIKAFS